MDECRLASSKDRQPKGIQARRVQLIRCRGYRRRRFQLVREIDGRGGIGDRKRSREAFVVRKQDDCEIQLWKVGELSREAVRLAAVADEACTAVAPSPQPNP